LAGLSATPAGKIFEPNFALESAETPPGYINWFMTLSSKAVKLMSTMASMSARVAARTRSRGFEVIAS
jgi:hypothetical protein